MRASHQEKTGGAGISEQEDGRCRGAAEDYSGVDRAPRLHADYAPDPIQGARWEEAAFAEEDEEDDGDATVDENEASLACRPAS